MSIINQMLRELDARNQPVPAKDAPAHAASRPRKRAGAGLAAAVILLVAGGTAYWANRPATHRAAVPDAQPTASAARVSAPAPAASAPPATLSVRASDAPATASPGRTESNTSEAPPGAPARPAPEVTSAPSAAPAFKLSSVLSIRPQASPVSAAPSATAGKVVVNAPETEARQLIDDAEAARRAGNSETALARYRQALALAPSMSQARLALAGLLRDTGHASEALAVLESGYALRAQPALAIAAGRLLADQGRREDALDWLMRGRESSRPADLALMGALYAQLQRHEEAVAAYRSALAADASNGGWWLGLGVSLEALGRREDARTAYRNALERGTFKPEVERFLREKSGAQG